MRPIPFRISQWDSATQVLHKCAKCGASFQIYEDKQQFCHMCGEKIDWEGVILHCTKEESERYHQSFHKDFKEGEKERLDILFKLYKKEIK